MRNVEAHGVEITARLPAKALRSSSATCGEADDRNFYNFPPLLTETFTVIACDQRDTREPRNHSEVFQRLGSGRAFYTAIGGRPENWSDSFFLRRWNRWAIGDVKAAVEHRIGESRTRLR